MPWTWGEIRLYCWNRGRYGELLTVLDRSPGSAETLLWAVRCRVEQGYIRAAAGPGAEGATPGEGPV